LNRLYARQFWRRFAVPAWVEGNRRDLDGHNDDTQYPEPTSQPPLPDDPSFLFLFAQAEQKFHVVSLS